ncbi:MAG: T9SS type A sorting domain-containing protein, partial [Tannerella sp.]|nr:T9SS type A sorting domain-containing protein [Tannerella sp.]
GAKLYITAGSRDVRATVYTLTGMPVKTLRVAAGETATETLPTGVYIVVPDDGGARSKVFIGSF